MITSTQIQVLFMLIWFAYSLYCFFQKKGDAQYSILVAIFLALILIWKP